MSDDPLVECNKCGNRFELTTKNMHEHAFYVGNSSKDWFCSTSCAAVYLQRKVNYHTEQLEFYSAILGKIASKAIDMQPDLESGEYYSFEEGNWLTFKFDLREDMTKFNDKPSYLSFEAILIDYGIIGCHKHLAMLRKPIMQGIPVAWCGALQNWYDEDVRKKFPTYDFAHGLESCGHSTDDILYFLYNLFAGEKKDDS